MINLASKNRPGAVALALSDEQREDFCAYLRTVEGLTGKKIKALCQERYGVKIGLGAAYTFMQGPLADYLVTLRQRRLKRTLLKEANGDPTDGTSDAEAAGMDLAEFLQDFTSSGGLDTIDLTDANGIKQLANLTLAAKRLRSDDIAMTRLKSDLEESARKLKLADLRIEESERKAQAAVDAVDNLTKRKVMGLSIAARNAIRREQGLPPLEEAEAA